MGGNSRGWGIIGDPSSSCQQAASTDEGPTPAGLEEKKERRGSTERGERGYNQHESIIPYLLGEEGVERGRVAYAIRGQPSAGSGSCKIAWEQSNVKGSTPCMNRIRTPQERMRVEGRERRATNHRPARRERGWTDLTLYVLDPPLRGSDGIPGQERALERREGEDRMDYIGKRESHREERERKDGLRIRPSENRTKERKRKMHMGTERAERGMGEEARAGRHVGRGAAVWTAVWTAKEVRERERSPCAAGTRRNRAREKERAEARRKGHVGEGSRGGRHISCEELPIH